MGRRTGLMLGLGAVLGAGLVAGAAGCFGSGGTPATPAAAAPTVGADSALPAPKDLGPGWRRVTAPGREAPAWPWALRRCVLYDAADYPSLAHREKVWRQAYAGPGGQSISVVVERFRAGWGTRSMDDVRRVLDLCVRYEYSDASTEFLDSHTTTLETFAGDDSLLVETVRITTQRPAENRFTAVVRRGDLVITIVGVEVAQERLPELARLLAARA